VDALGCFPLDAPRQRGRTFFKQATSFLKSDASIGIFPEGTGPMVAMTQADEVGPFHRGFAHLALRASLSPSSSAANSMENSTEQPENHLAGNAIDQPDVQPAAQPNLKIVPAAIISLEESRQDMVPFKVFSWFDPTEPLFQQAGRHPAVIYRRVAVVIGEPIDVRDFRGQSYHGKRAGQVANELSDLCHDKIQTLLKKGCY
ncbi:MAG: 1-acyl-sn-glycerol-3-phosphate acyltransferase, partial [Cyanobacteria bacterium J06635_11]